MEAKHRLDPEYAFSATCKIGTVKAFEGFLASYPTNEHVSAIKAYLEFLKELPSGKRDIKSCKKFISAHPENPFVVEVKLAVPILWLKEKGDTVGVFLRVHELVSKGILGGGQEKESRAYTRVWGQLKKQFEQEGIRVVLLDSLESKKIADEGLKDIVMVEYTQTHTDDVKSVSRSSGPGLEAYVTDSLNNAAAENLADIFYNPADELYSITIKRISDGVQYYSEFESLSAPRTYDAKINRSEALSAIHLQPDPALQIVEDAPQEMRW